MENKYGVKIGDIFVNSWGYEQTNIDFYQVTALRGTTMVELRKLNKLVTAEDGTMSRYSLPIKGAYVADEPPFRRAVKQWRGSGEPYCKAEYGFLRLADPIKPQLETSYY